MSNVIDGKEVEPMISHEEMTAVTAEGFRDAINGVLSRTLISGNKLDVGILKVQEIEHTIHLLRYYKALRSEA